MNIESIRRIASRSAVLKTAFRTARLVRYMMQGGVLRPLLFSPPGHFYSPIPNTDSAIGNERNCKEQYLAGIDLNRQRQLEQLTALSSNTAGKHLRDEPSEGNRYYLDNQFYSYGDGAILFSMIEKYRPKRIIEVGSGFSSALMLDAREQLRLDDLHLTFIEPFTQRLESLIRTSDRHVVEIHEKAVQNVDLAIYEELVEGDFLFIDSSHVGRNTSDVLHILFNVLPVLKSGVIVHFHDIPWPFEYPGMWFKDGRAWNEAYFLRAFLQFNNEFEIVLFNSFLHNCCAKELSECMSIAMRTSTWPLTLTNSSLWLRVVGRS